MPVEYTFRGNVTYVARALDVTISPRTIDGTLTLDDTRPDESSSDFIGTYTDLVTAFTGNIGGHPISLKQTQGSQLFIRTDDAFTWALRVNLATVSIGDPNWAARLEINLRFRHPSRPDPVETSPAAPDTRLYQDRTWTAYFAPPGGGQEDKIEGFIF